MCGIFGVTSKWALTIQDEKFLRSATIAGAVRGTDSTGYIMSGDKTPSCYFKKAVNGTTMVEEHFTPTRDLAKDINIVVGHNRAATMGEVNDDNAHPFIEGNLIGVHNGTLHGNWNSELEVSNKLKVDSIGIYRAMNARGVEWTIKHMHGAAALVWQEIDSRRTFVYRNSQRPLHYAINDAGTKVWYASEMMMLMWILDRHNIKYKTIESFEEKHHYEITGGKVVDLGEMEQPTYPKSLARGGLGTSRAQNVTHITPGGEPTGMLTAPTVQELFKPEGDEVWYKDAGVSYRGRHVSEGERRRGIVGEYVERGFEIYTCRCCGDPIFEATFLENDWCNLSKEEYEEYSLHTSCLESHRRSLTHSDNHKVVRIKRDWRLQQPAIDKYKASNNSQGRYHSEYNCIPF